MFGAAAALCLTLGVLFLCLRLLGRLQGGRPLRGRGTLEVLQRVGLGPKQGVVLLRAGNRVLIVGTGDGHTTLLGELDPAAREAVLDEPAAEAGPPPLRPARWRGALQRLALFLLLVVVSPGGSAAQTVTSPKPAVARGGTRAQAPAVTVAPVAPPRIDLQLGNGADGLKLSGAVGVTVFLGFLTLLPALFLLTTSFTRVLVVLHFLRSAIGTQTAPPTQLLVAVAVLLTGVIMGPVLQEANREGIQPYLRGEIGQVQAYERGVQPLRRFMIANTRDQDLATFARISRQQEADSLEQLPTTTVVAAFVTSELRTSFQMGFVIFLPFLVIDLVVASVLMSMGMFMLPPVMISLPFKLLLFVLADGWSLVMQSLVASFRG
ncbi:MAG: flagellar type III secretion system pore protein FliP [Gemmatimonadales bacterium]|nr:flagellar type III secretion system pore protein FliP [Gemmatimonadales bacterium]